MSICEISINGGRYNVLPKEHTVSYLKKLASIAQADDLCIEHAGRLITLADSASIIVCHGAKFISCIKPGGTA